MKTTEIPAITEPLGRYWEQPNRKNIIIDDKHALMTKEDFEKIPDYSFSQPTGVYAGKMWKGSDDKKTWYLKWWSAPDKSDKSGMCDGNVREILIIQ